MSKVHDIGSIMVCSANKIKSGPIRQAGRHRVGGCLDLQHFRSSDSINVQYAYTDLGRLRMLICTTTMDGGALPALPCF